METIEHAQVVFGISMVLDHAKKPYMLYVDRYWRYAYHFHDIPDATQVTLLDDTYPWYGKVAELYADERECCERLKTVLAEYIVNIVVSNLQLRYLRRDIVSTYTGKIRL